VSWCATCDGFFVRDQDIVVVGGGDSAVEEATFLTRFARSLTMVHRRDALRASKIMQERAFNNDKIRLDWDSEVLEAVGTDRLEGLRLRNLKTGQEKLFDATGMFVAIGHDPRSELVKGQVQLDDEGYVVVQGLHSTATDVPGVFAAGDLVDHTYRQAITAAGTGCAAALDAEPYLTMLKDTPPSRTSASTPASRPSRRTARRCRAGTAAHPPPPDVLNGALLAVADRPDRHALTDASRRAPGSTRRRRQANWADRTAWWNRSRPALAS
jgi:hypothetical protein